MLPTTNHILRLCAAWAALAVPAGAARLEVRAVHSPGGRVFERARVLVFSSGGQEVCRGAEGIAVCDLPDGDYRVRAKLSGYGAEDQRVRMEGKAVYREIVLEIEEPVDRGPLGNFTRKRASR